MNLTKRFQLCDVGLLCSCGGPYGAHYEERTYPGPSRFIRSGCDHCIECTEVHWQAASFQPPAPEYIFGNYRRLLADESTKRTSEWTFKSNPIYQQFLEHVTREQGESYLRLIQSMSMWETIRPIIITTTLDNDSIGHPVKHPTSIDLTCSPTNMRYAHQALILLQHIDKLGINSTNIFEIGGGYGGLALFVHRLSTLFCTPILSYTIIDVPESGPIQAAYASTLGFSLHIVNGTDKQAIENSLKITDAPNTRTLVSTYGFSELSSGIRDWYERTLTPACSHGFLMWNRIEPYPLTETPITVIDDPVLVESGTKIVLY